MSVCRHITGLCHLIAVSLLFMQPVVWGADPTPGGTLRVAWEADATGFDPGFSRGIQAYYLKGNIFNPLVKEPKIQVWTGKGSSTAFSAFNVSRKPFDDPKVRVALAGYGIDRRAIAKAALLSHGGPQWGFLPPGAKGFQDLSERYPYDPEKARA